MSDLLPRQYGDFRKKEYWEDFFRKRNDQAFEWYGEYAQLRPEMYNQLSLAASAASDDKLQSRVKQSLKVLVVGCGNSALSHDLYSDGFKSLVSIDFSDLVIKEMQNKHPEMEWKVMDMTNMNDFKDETFDVVLDKGALDALMAENTEAIRADATKMLSEIKRVLAPGGKYFCVSMAQDFILDHLLTFCCNPGASDDMAWGVKIAEMPRDARKPFVPFLISAIKCSPDMKSVPQTVTYNEKTYASKDGDERKQWLIHEVEATQWYAMTQVTLRQLRIGRQEIVELISHDAGAASNTVPRFTLRLVDVSMKGNNGSCAVFLIPQGRETEWMFATEEGAWELGQGAGFSRLIMVALGRGHVFQSTDQVQEELNGKIMELAPETLTKNEKIPYLTVDEGLGKRNIVHQGKSQVSGEYFIEEVDDAGDHLRRLIFLSNTSVIQSEVRLVEAKAETSATDSKSKKKRNKRKKKKNGGNKVVDQSYLAFDYHNGMVAALHAACLANAQDKEHKSLLIGLGGGALAKYVHDNVPNVSMTAVELDPEVVSIAEDYFGFEQDERMDVIVGDGLEYIATTAQADKEHYDSIVIDVDAKERSVGMSCPPVSFVQEVFLKQVYASLESDGVLLINVSCRDKQLYQQILSTLRDVFKPSEGVQNASVFRLKATDQDVNSVIFVRKQSGESNVSGNDALKRFKEAGKRKGKGSSLPSYVDSELSELIREIDLA